MSDERARWYEEAKSAAAKSGWTEVEYGGIDDYQGWGVLLIRNGEQWGVLPWSYGSCGGCDEYEDLSDVQQCAAFTALIETAADEATARMLFDSRKGW